MKYAFFPGCSLESTAWDFDQSTRQICEALGIELVDIPDWVCCGSTPAHTTNASLAVSLPVLNLQKAGEMGTPVMAACASCYSRLRTANYKVREDANERERAERITNKPYAGDVEVHHVLDALVNHYGLKEIGKKVKQPLSGMKIACYLRLPVDSPAGNRGLRRSRASQLHGRISRGLRSRAGRVAFEN